MVLVDGHVHIYDCYSLQTFLDSALSNFETEAARENSRNPCTFLLLLTETSSQDCFHQILEHASGEGKMRSALLQNWSAFRTQEETSIRMQRPSGQELILIAGRQLVTSEGLEVLALGTKDRFSDGAELLEIVRTIRELGGLPVIPWGPGKWIGSRGQRVHDLMNRPESSWIFLGDNGNRLNFWPSPPQFTYAQSAGIRILPGTDPLPFPFEQKRAGSFGFQINRTIRPDYPTTDLTHMLLDKSVSIRHYGHLESIWRFLPKQIAMQARKQVRTRTTVRQ